LQAENERLKAADLALAIRLRRIYLTGMGMGTDEIDHHCEDEAISISEEVEEIEAWVKIQDRNHDTKVAALQLRIKELEARIYGERDLWRDEFDDEARNAAHAEADMHGQPVHVNVHGVRRYTARPKRIVELKAELAAIKEPVPDDVMEAARQYVSGNYNSDDEAVQAKIIADYCLPRLASLAGREPRISQD
jgi:hypothetical protein